MDRQPYDPSERDVDRGEDQVETFPTGGVPQPGAPDANETTGTTPNEEFVGRTAGQDTGYEGTTGADARADDGGEGIGGAAGGRT